MMTVQGALGILFAVNVAMAADAPEAVTRKVLADVQARYARLKNWEAKFTQETASVGLGRSSFSKGELKFAAPNKFYYSIAFPDPSDFVSNGKEAWQIIYRKGHDKPAYVRHFKSIDDTGIEKYLVIFRGWDPKTKGPFKDFTITGTNQNGNLDLELKPKETSEEISRLSIRFEKSREAPSNAVLVDALENKTTIVIESFSILKTAPSDEFFRPKIPKDSEIEEF